MAITCVFAFVFRLLPLGQWVIVAAGQRREATSLFGASSARAISEQIDEPPPKE